MKFAVVIPSIATAGMLGFGDLPRPEVTSAAVPAAPLHQSTGNMIIPTPADTVTLAIEGMTCGGCTLATRKVLERLDGVRKAEVSYEKKNAVVVFDAAKVTVAEMIDAVATLKYTATVAKP